MPTLKAIHICNSHQPTLQPKIAKEYVFANADRQTKKNNEGTTMCIIHKGFRGKRALSPASILGGKLTGLKPAIPYEIIH